MSGKLVFVYACVVFSVYSTKAETLHKPCTRATSADAQGDCSVGEVCTVADTFDASDGCSYIAFENKCFKCGCGNLDQCVIVWPVSRGGIMSPYPSYICNCDNGLTGDNCDVSPLCVHGFNAEVTVGSTLYAICTCDTNYFGHYCNSDLTTALQVGVRVIRGTDWKWNTQDSFGPGTITDVSTGGWVKVEWDSGNTYFYRMSAQGAYDLFFI